jgi:hypothetical protein
MTKNTIRDRYKPISKNTKTLDGFQVDFDVGNWYPWFGSHIMIHFVGISTVVCGSFGWVVVATAAILKFLSLKIMCTHVRQNFWNFSSNSEHHSKPTMIINSQHHNLLEDQISPKSYLWVDYDVANWYPSLVCYCGYFESKMVAKIQKSSDLDETQKPSILYSIRLKVNNSGAAKVEYLTKKIKIQLPAISIFLNHSSRCLCKNYIQVGRLLRNLRGFRDRVLRLLAEQKLMKRDRNNIHI